MNEYNNLSLFRCCRVPAQCLTREINYLHFLAINKTKPVDASRSAEAKTCDCKSNKLSVRFRIEELSYLMFSFSCSGNEKKRSVKLSHSIHNACRIQRKVQSRSKKPPLF